MAPWGAAIATADDQERDHTPNPIRDKNRCPGLPHPRQGAGQRPGHGAAGRKHNDLFRFGEYKNQRLGKTRQPNIQIKTASNIRFVVPRAC